MRTKQAIIFDLDNTIYPVHSIGNELFAPLFQLISENENDADRLASIKNDIMRRPFQVVAADYEFRAELTQKGIEILKNLVYTGEINSFPDYSYTKVLPVQKFLVTTGFLKLQQSKVTALGLEHDFTEIYIVDPSASGQTKKDVFAAILEKYGYAKEEVLVVGDDLYSEIKAAQELGIKAVLYDPFDHHPDITAVSKISNFKQLEAYLL